MPGLSSSDLFSFHILCTLTPKPFIVELKRQSRIMALTYNSFFFLFWQKLEKWQKAFDSLSLLMLSGLSKEPMKSRLLKRMPLFKGRDKSTLVLDLAVKKMSSLDMLCSLSCSPSPCLRNLSFQ